MPRKIVVLISLCLAWLAAGSTADEQGDGDALIAAAQRQEIDEVRRLLAAGVDVDSESRYGATALFFASDKGNVELVKLLLEKGADVDVSDTFYKATPLTWSLFSAPESPPHREIVMLLLEHGPANADAALNAGARAGDKEMVEKALAKGKIEPAAVRAALQLAEGGGHQEVAAFLRGKAPEPSESETFEVSPEKLASYAGEYKNNDIALGIKVFIDGEELKLQGTGQPAVTLDATGEDAFTARDVPGIDVSFQGRGGLIEGFQLRQGGQELYIPRVPSGDAVAEKPAKLPPLPEAERSEPIQWPRFRGTAASGIGDGQGAPSSWDGESGEGVRWKTKIPGLAHSSPVVWDGRVFLTSAVPESGDESLRTGLYGDVDSVDDDSVHTWTVLALDKTTGEILWQKTATEGRPRSKRHLKATQANPTPATDGEYLVAHFGSEGLFCYNTDGEKLWHQDWGTLASGWFFDSTYEWGFSSSPILHDGKVITQVDVDKGSFIAAYDLATGREAWKTKRDEIPTWGTPVVLPPAAGKGAHEIVTNGTTIRGYHAGTGGELWRLTPNSEVTVGSPVVSGGVAFVTGGYPPVRPIYAVRPGGRGDLTLPEGAESSEHLAWSTTRGGTYIPTPIVYRGILYMLHNNGRMTAHHAATGEQIYRTRVQTGSFSSSPVAADGRLYFTSEEGTTTVVRAGETYQVLGTNELSEVVMTTAAISDGLMLLRGASHLYGLAEVVVEESSH
ncbi:MAG: PQQ-binding-like beta-propeller repeat protein [bacterium]|nr:PQQ-binding-like beta-propeller repeat protein [bacterium]